MQINPTIFALATPLGKSGVAVVRISGQGALAALITLTGKQEWQPNQLVYSVLGTPYSVLDHAMAVYFQAPRSFTGEDVAELHIHGSLAVIREALETLAAMEGLRPAERGEFARRAYLNGKIDLMQAEGLADMIDAETSAQKSQATRQMEGRLSVFYDELRSNIVRTLAHLEAYIDFPDEEIPESVLLGLDDEVRKVQAIIAKALNDGKRGERLREGVSIVILGAPNAGKSSLMNALAGRDVAIVSERAGTTRDVIEIHMEFSGYPALLMDTAGLRDAQDEVESEGIKRARARAGEADIKLVLFDTTRALDAESLALVDDKTIIVTTKYDLPSSLIPHSSSHLSVSTHTGQGIDALLAAIESRIVENFSGEGAMITRQRHRTALEQADRHLEAYFTPLPLELKCEELRRAAYCIGQITGKIAVDDVLDVVFHEFCIGK